MRSLLVVTAMSLWACGPSIIKLQDGTVVKAVRAEGTSSTEVRVTTGDSTLQLRRSDVESIRFRGTPWIEVGATTIIFAGGALIGTLGAVASCDGELFCGVGGIIIGVPVVAILTSIGVSLVVSGRSKNRRAKRLWNLGLDPRARGATPPRVLDSSTATDYRIGRDPRVDVMSVLRGAVRPK